MPLASLTRGVGGSPGRPPPTRYLALRAVSIVETPVGAGRRIEFDKVPRRDVGAGTQRCVVGYRGYRYEYASMYFPITALMATCNSWLYVTLAALA